MSQVYPEFLEPPDFEDEEYESIGVGALEFDSELEVDPETGTARQLNDYWRDRD